jgi:hypothetical protein
MCTSQNGHANDYSYIIYRLSCVLQPRFGQILVDTRSIKKPQLEFLLGHFFTEFIMHRNLGLARKTVAYVRMPTAQSAPSRELIVPVHRKELEWPPILGDNDNLHILSHIGLHTSHQPLLPARSARLWSHNDPFDILAYSVPWARIQFKHIDPSNPKQQNKHINIGVRSKRALRLCFLSVSLHTPTQRIKSTRYLGADFGSPE